jgi:hypothetical protein
MYDIGRILNDPLTREAIIARLIKEEGFLRIKGDVDIVVRDIYGKKTDERLVRNLVVNTGLYHIADRMQDTPLDEAAMGWAGIGTNNTAAIATDTALLAEVGRVALTSKIQGTGGNANQVTYTATVPAGTGTGTIVEAAIFNASSAGIMLARTVFAPIVKGVGDAVDISWVLTFSAA